MAKILIIEDDTDINNMIAEYLSERNMEVEQAFSGTEGKLLWQMNPFDLLILDLMLPGMSGEELTAWIRKNSQVPIIVLTRGIITDSLRSLALEKGYTPFGEKTMCRFTPDQ